MSWSDAFVGALSGGAAGSAGGPYGALAGAGLGFIGGLLHKSAPNPPDDVRRMQLADMARLRAVASGQTETAADKLLRTQTARDIANQYALANTLRSRTPGAAARLASQGTLAATANATEQATILKAREQQAAEQALAGEEAAVRSGDLGAFNAARANANDQNLFTGSQLAGASAGLGAWLQKRNAPAPITTPVAPVAAPTTTIPTSGTQYASHLGAGDYTLPMTDPTQDENQAQLQPLPYYRSPSYSTGQR